MTLQLYWQNTDDIANLLVKHQWHCKYSGKTSMGFANMLAKHQWHCKYVGENTNGICKIHRQNTNGIANILVKTPLGSANTLGGLFQFSSPVSQKLLGPKRTPPRPHCSGIVPHYSGMVPNCSGIVPRCRGMAHQRKSSVGIFDSFFHQSLCILTCLLYSSPSPRD